MTDQNGSSDRPEAAPGAPVGQKSEQTPAGDGTADTGSPAETAGQVDRSTDTADTAAGSGHGKAKSGPAKLNELVDEPAKVMRIGTMIKQLLEEVRNAPLDDAARNRLAEIHSRSLKELEDGLAPELVDELHRINLPFLDDSTPTDAELRIAQAQLVGWLEGLFRGIQTAIAAQQTASHAAGRLQLRQLPPGTILAPGVVIGDDGEPHRAQGPQGAGSPRPEPQSGPGQYL
ncbi:bacterial proteasome activator family protein [Arthrobacter sp. zg-Y877]|uniref:bacterial proteasome activator family protein n=1 Tax=Arthrobacter sp. zg-Y877 TaxID=3049074 RepID=UPI0025A43DD4|nr:bacterial proteasome activator family protein [Arthrobacter sp. zg-Y877]MDM7991670.1 bacterial proteasome activator family protein [Arthrobacter sp. zg-Y877]